MDLSLLGCDDDALRLVRYLTLERGHRVRAAYGVTTLSPAWTELLAGVRVENGWEGLLDVTAPGLVLVSRSETLDARYEPLRGLAQAEVPMLIVHPGCTAIAALELDMIRRDTGILVTPYLPAVWHPAVQQLVALVRSRPDSSSPLGECRRLDWERHMPGNSRSQVFAQLARDAAVLRCLAGELQRVTALGSPATGATLANLSVSLTAPHDLLVQWNLLPDHEPSAQLTVQGSQGRATLEIPALDAPWNLAIEGAESTRQSYPADADLPAFAAWLESVWLEGVAGRGPTAHLSLLPGSGPAYDWGAACHGLEVMETAEASLRRGRALDLQTETPTQEATFKAMMAAGGCGLLLLTLLMFGVFAVVGGLQLAHQGPAGDPTAGDASPYSLWLRLWPIYPFALFLILQLLLMVARPSPKKKS